MKFPRMLALMLAVGAFPPVMMQAHGQQEVDPDHYPQAPAVKANMYSPKAGTNQQATAGQQGRKQTRTASKHSGRKPNHRQVQA